MVEKSNQELKNRLNEVERGKRSAEAALEIGRASCRERVLMSV